MAVPYTFGSATSSIPLSQLDSNFATAITLGNTAIQLGNTVTTLNNMTLANVTISSGNVTITSVTLANANITGTTTLSGLTASTALALDASKNIVSVTNTGTGNNVLAGSPTLTGTVNAASLTLTTDLTLSGGTANGVAYLNGSKVVTSGSALTFDGSKLAVSGAGIAGADDRIFTVTNTAANSYGAMTLVGTSRGGYLNFYNGATAQASIVGQASALSFYVGTDSSGSQSMILNSTGLGIGTSSPTTKLDVVGSGDGEVRIRASSDSALIFSETTANKNWKLKPSAGDFYWQYSATAYNSGYSALMALTSTGNLGIGTSSPAAKLHVQATQASMNMRSTGTGNPYIDFYTSTSSLVGNIYGIDGGGMAIGTSGGTERLRVDASGNLGLGVTPSAWTTFKVMQLGNFGAIGGVNSTSMNMFANTFYDGAFKYINTASASRYRMDGEHTWYVAPSGTAGNAITFTQAMTLDASGNLGVGTTSPSEKLEVAGTIKVTGTNVYIAPSTGTSATYLLTANTGGNFFFAIDNSTGSSFGAGAYSRALYSSGAYPMAFFTSDLERARIDSSGNLLVGTTSQLYGAAGSRLNVDAGANGGATLKTSGGSAQATLYSFNSATTGDNAFISFGTEGTFTQRGSITYNRAGGLVAYNVTSDYRAKDISGPVINSGALIDSVPVYMGKIKGATQERPMFIAHETPEYAHTGEKDAVDADGNPVYQQMDASALIPVMWAEIQSLRKRLADAGI